jgi:hypothetical protein
MAPTPLWLLSAPIGDRLEDLAVAAVKQLQRARHLVLEERGAYHDRLRERGMLHPDALVVFLEDRGGDAGAVAQAKAWLAAGLPVTLTASSGLPCFVDPGGALVDWALEQGPDQIAVEPVGVSSALDAILCVSGVNLHAFFFAGHLPEHLTWPDGIGALRVPIALYVRGEALPALAPHLARLPGRWRLTLGEELRKRRPGAIVRHSALDWTDHPALQPRPGRGLVALVTPIIGGPGALPPDEPSGDPGRPRG